jgi:hypothetical protein
MSTFLLILYAAEYSSTQQLGNPDTVLLYTVESFLSNVSRMFPGVLSARKAPRPLLL